MSDAQSEMDRAGAARRRAAVGRRRTSPYDRLSRPFQGYEGEEQFVEIRPESGRPRSRTRWWRPASCATDGRSASRWLAAGPPARLQAGEYRFDRPMTAAQVVDGHRARQGVRALRHLSRGADDPGDGEDSSRPATSAAPPSFATAPREKRRRSCRTSIRRPATSRGTSFRRRTRSRDSAGAPQLVRMMVARFRDVFTPDLQAAARRAGALAAAGGDARLARREGDREARRAADRRRRVPATG